MERKMRGLLLYLAIAMLVLAACSKKGEAEEPVPEPENEDEEEIIIEEEDPVALFMAPFTGVMTEEENLRRPVLATINNHPQARPQSGISEADIIL